MTDFQEMFFVLVEFGFSFYNQLCQPVEAAILASIDISFVRICYHADIVPMNARWNAERNIGLERRAPVGTSHV